jgi:hypothetical protein
LPKNFANLFFYYFRISGFEFHFTPKEYLNHYTADQCVIMGGELDANYYRLPAQFLHDKCLLLDYEKKRVGLATRVF